MPLQIPPPFEQAAEDYVQRLQEQDTQYTKAIERKQGEIAGTAGPAPGLQASEDLNADLYAQLSILVLPFEAERRALDGQYGPTPLTEADILEAATTRTGVLFPPGNIILVPTRVPWLDGAGGSDASNEDAALTSEEDALAVLFSLDEVDRASAPEYATWVAALGIELSVLNTEAAALAANEEYGIGHPAYTDVQTALGYVNALLPTPPVTDLDITTRQGQVGLRHGQVANRVLDNAEKVDVHYDHRFQVLQGRVNLVIGSLARLVSTQKGIANIELIQGINSDLLALYNLLV